MKLQFELNLAAPIAQVFHFHENPGNLLQLHMNSGFELLRQDGSIQIGSQTWMKQKLYGIFPIVMHFRHFLYDPPHIFAEEQITGPFKTFRHFHEFEETSSGTLLRDNIEVKLPSRLGGELAVRLFVAPHLRRTFQYRHKELLRIFNSNAATQPTSRSVNA